jgi:hypothetical protein
VGLSFVVQTFPQEARGESLQNDEKPRCNKAARSADSESQERPAFGGKPDAAVEG